MLQIKMNHIAFGLILICCLARAIETNGYHMYAKRTTLEEFLEKFKVVLKTGNESLGIPVLDPFVAERATIKLNEHIINLTNVNINGLSEYKVIDADYQIIGMNVHVNLSWPSITARTGYDVKINFHSYEIYGSGEIDLSAKDFTLAAEISLTMNEEHFKVRNMKLKLYLSALDFHLTGLLNDDELSNVLSAMISDMAPELLENAIVVDKLKLFAIEKIDAFLSTKTTEELWEIFSSILMNASYNY